MGDLWIKCVPKGKSEGRGTKRELVLGRQGHRVLGPSLARPWNACSHHQAQRGSQQFRLDHVWAGGWARQSPLWVCCLLWHCYHGSVTLGWEEREISGLEHELKPSQKREFCFLFCEGKATKSKTVAHPSLAGGTNREPSSFLADSLLHPPFTSKIAHRDIILYVLQE